MGVGTVRKPSQWGLIQGRLAEQEDLLARVGTFDVDETDIADGRIQVFDAVEGKKKYVDPSGGDTLFLPLTWASSIDINVDFTITIPDGSLVASTTIAVSGDSNGTFRSGTIYNNDSTSRTINLPVNDLVGKDLVVPIVLESLTALDIGFKNDGIKRTWQFSKTKINS